MTRSRNRLASKMAAAVTQNSRSRDSGNARRAIAFNIQNTATSAVAPSTKKSGIATRAGNGASGALALLALGGTAAAVMGRRRRRKEQELADEKTMAFEPFETAAAPEPDLTLGPRLREDDLLVTIGAGDVFRLAEALVEQTASSGHEAAGTEDART